MKRHALIALALMAAPAAAEDYASCADQATWMIGNMPGFVAQTGIGSADAFEAEKTRLLLAQAGFAHSLGMMQGEDASDYWRAVLVVTDGLVRCYDDGRKDLTDEQRDLAKTFEERFPPDARAKVVALALSELKG